MYERILIPISQESNMKIIVDFLDNFLNPDGVITLLYIVASDKLPISAVEWRRAMSVVSATQVLSLEKGLEVNYLVKNANSVVDGILNEVSSSSYDLLFFASSTYRKKRESIFGSKVDEVVRKAPVETVVLRYIEDRPVQYKKILLPTSGYKNALEAVKMAEVLASKSNGEVTFLYVGDSKAAADKVLDPLVKRLAGKGIKASRLFKKGAPADAILKESEKDYDLLMIGATERPYYYEFLLGSTADRIVREAPCPVLMVKTTSQ